MLFQSIRLLIPCMNPGSTSSIACLRGAFQAGKDPILIHGSARERLQQVDKGLLEMAPRARVVPSSAAVQDMDLEPLLRNAEQLGCLQMHRLMAMAAQCQELRIARHELVKSFKHQLTSSPGRGDVENGLLVRSSSIFATYRRDRKAIHGRLWRNNLPPFSSSYRAMLVAGIGKLGSSSTDGSLHDLENQLLIAAAAAAAAAVPEEQDVSRFVETVVLIHDFRNKLDSHLQGPCSSCCKISCAERSWLSMGMPTMKFKSY